MSFTILQKLSLTCLKADQPLLSKFIQRKHCHNRKNPWSKFPFTATIRNASKKTGGSTRNKKGHPRPKHRGWRVQDGHYVSQGTLLATQLTTRFHPGLNVSLSKHNTFIEM